MEKKDFGRLNNLYYFVTWKKWILVYWKIKIVYYFVSW